jgi:hypothetical protein
MTDLLGSFEQKYDSGCYNNFNKPGPHFAEEDLNLMERHPGGE